MKKELFAALFESALIFKRVAGALRPQYVRLLGAMTRGVNEAGAEDVRRMGEIFGLQPARIAQPQRRGSAFMWGGLVLALCNSAPAAMYTYNYSVNQAIPDNSIVGLTDSHSLSGLLFQITDVRVTLNLSGGYNGDLYGYLRLNDSPLVVLLNRVGVTGSDPDGYADSGFSVTLAASASHDIHFYQDFSPTYNGNGQLTGTWQADGRSDPLSSSRGSLTDFNGLNPNGTWTLFFADQSPGDESTLLSWSLDIAAVPEPVNVALGLFAALAAAISFAGQRRNLLRTQPQI